MDKINAAFINYNRDVVGVCIFVDDICYKFISSDEFILGHKDSILGIKESVFHTLVVPSTYYKGPCSGENVYWYEYVQEYTLEEFELMAQPIIKEIKESINATLL